MCMWGGGAEEPASVIAQYGVDRFQYKWRERERETIAEQIQNGKCQPPNALNSCQFTSPLVTLKGRAAIAARWCWLVAVTESSRLPATILLSPSYVWYGWMVVRSVGGVSRKQPVPWNNCCSCILMCSSQRVCLSLYKHIFALILATGICFATVRTITTTAKNTAWIMEA